MNNFRFVGYQKTPNDQYMLGVATVVVYEKVILRFKHVKKKDGQGDFFSSASYGVDDGGQKKYLDSFCLNNRTDEDELLAFVRTNVLQASRNQTQTQMMQPPHGMLPPIQTPNLTPNAFEFSQSGEGMPF